MDRVILMDEYEFGRYFELLSTLSCKKVMQKLGELENQGVNVSFLLLKYVSTHSDTFKDVKINVSLVDHAKMIVSMNDVKEGLKRITEK